MAPRTTIAAAAAAENDSADHGLIYSESTGFMHGLIGNFSAEFLEESIEIVGDTITGSKLGKVTINLAKFGIASAAGLLSGAGLQKTVDKVEINWEKDGKVTLITGALGELAVLAAGMAGAPAAITSAGIAATAATVYDGATNAKGMKERIEDALKLQEKQEAAKEAAKLRGEELELTDFERRLQGVESHGRRVAAEMFPEQEAQTGGNGTAAGTNHNTGSTKNGGHGHGNQNGGYGYGYNTQQGGTPPDSGTPAGGSNDTPADGDTTTDTVDQGGVCSNWQVVTSGRQCAIADWTPNENSNPEDPSSDGKTSPPSVGPAPGDIGGKYSQLMNPGSERGGRPSPDGDSSDGRGPKGPRPGDMSSVMNSDDYGCDPITAGGIGGGTQDEIGWNFFKTPPKKGGGRYGSSGTGFDDDYKPNPEDDYGVGGPTAKFFEGIQSGSSFEFAGTQSFEISNELQANNLMLMAMSVDTFGL
jgi:hypothetical protein